MPDRGGVPSRPTARRAFAHGFELADDLLERAIGHRGGNAGDQPHQTVIAALPLCAPEQRGLDDAFRGQPPHGAAHPLDRPGGIRAAVQDADDVAPGLVRAHPPHRRQPGVKLCEHALQVPCVAAGAQLADRLRVAGAQC